MEAKIVVFLPGSWCSHPSSQEVQSQWLMDENKGGVLFSFYEFSQGFLCWFINGAPTDTFLSWVTNPSLHGYFCALIFHCVTESRGVFNFFFPSEVRNMFFPRRGRPGSGDAEPVIAPDIHWAFFSHPFVWVCMFPHMPINVSVLAMVYKGLCAVTFSPPSWIFIRSGSWSLSVAGDLPLYIPDPVLSEQIPNA